MPIHYSVYGLEIRANLPIPGILPKPAPSPRAVDVEVRLGATPEPLGEHAQASEKLWYRGSEEDDSGEPVLRIWKDTNRGLFRLQYSDGVQFWVDPAGQNLWGTWPETACLEDATAYLLGPVLGFLMRVRGIVCLHASAVAVGDTAVAFLGAEGAGKSTTAAALARRGYPVLSDDIVALNERGESFYVAPACPHLWLWPESVGMLYGSAEALPRLSPNWEKRFLALSGEELRFEPRALRLGGIYVLGGRREDYARIMVEAIGARSALIALVSNSYGANVLDREMRAEEFAVLGRLVSKVILRRVYPHSDPSRLQDLCDVICEDIDSCLGQRSARACGD